MKRIFAFILSILMLSATLAGCGVKGKLAGTWQASVDLAEIMDQIIGDQWVSENYPIDRFPVTVQLTFSKDNTFTLTLSAASLEAATEQLIQDLERITMDNLQAQLNTLGDDVDLQALMELTGIDPNLLMEEFRVNFQNMGFTQTLQQGCSYSGWYKLSGDKLYLSATEEIDKKLCPCVTFVLEEGALAVTGFGTLPLNKEFAAMLDALTFQKS